MIVAFTGQTHLLFVLVRKPGKIKYQAKTSAIFIHRARISFILAKLNKYLCLG